MEALSLGLVAAVAAAIAVLARSRSQDTVPRQWRTMMAKLGLEFQRVERQHLVWQGKVEGQLVRVVLSVPPNAGQYPVMLTAGASVSIPPSLGLYGDSTLNTLGRLVDESDRDHTLGDPEFDEVAVLPALDAYACAALSHGARDWLVRLLRGGGHVERGRVVLTTSWSAASHQPLIASQLRWLCKVAGQLSVPPAALHERLARNARLDPAPDVRLCNLRFLVARETRTPQALLDSTARALLGDVHPPVQLLAALQLGADGLPTLRALLAGGAPQAICSTLAALQPEHAQPLLESVLGCTSSTHESVRAEAARVLGRWKQPETEPALTRLLAAPETSVQLAAAQSLGGFASVAAVEPLLPLAQALLDSQLRQAARSAISRIQARLGNVEAGRVSLAEPEPLAGALALADVAEQRSGELSLSEEQAEPAEQRERAPR